MVVWTRPISLIIVHRRKLQRWWTPYICIPPHSYMLFIAMSFISSHLRNLTKCLQKSIMSHNAQKSVLRWYLPSKAKEDIWFKRSIPTILHSIDIDLPRGIWFKLTFSDIQYPIPCLGITSISIDQLKVDQTRKFKKHFPRIRIWRLKKTG